jgi:hypothetical protein
MKKILFLALLVSLTLLNSCSIDDENIANFQFDFIPIEDVEMPQEFNFGETHVISVTYKRPTTCHSFSNFQYIQGEGNLRTIAVINLVTSDNNCETLEEDFQTETFSFSVLNLDPYTFRFWQGKDDNDQDIYLIYEVPVNN